MNRLKIYQVDAFADRLFTGNPAAVCMLEKWPDDELMLSIAAENNLAETAFIVPQEPGFLIRWYTPTVEVDLCGHATLASAFVLFNCLDYKGPEIKFLSPRSGPLRVFRQKDILFLDFPTDSLSPVSDHEQITGCLGTEARGVYKGKTDLVAVLEREAQVKDMVPDLDKISKLPCRGLIVTSPGEKVDFVSRFFAPQSGIDEDPVTGSAHTTLIPLWSEKLRKKEMNARQLSKRGGDLVCVNQGRPVLDRWTCDTLPHGRNTRITQAAAGIPANVFLQKINRCSPPALRSGEKSLFKCFLKSFSMRYLRPPVACCQQGCSTIAAEMTKIMSPQNEERNLCPKS